jgi:murein DD-endopeptidase MepM/ murein hydrolase activator NlpD
MREHYRITITSYAGARHYTVTQLMRRFLAVLAGTVAGLFLIGTLAIWLLSAKLGHLNSELASLQEQQKEYLAHNESLREEQRRLQSSVSEKVAELSQVNEELDAIENLIGVKPAPDAPLHARLDTASQTAFEKRYMLTTIPSGFPLDDSSITSRFGMRKHPVLGLMKLHGGVDLRAAVGTPVYATADGVVEWAGPHKSGLGRMILLDHNFGFESLYGHLNEVVVASGDYVKQGELIGYSGNTGLSSAPHLHYEVRHLNHRLAPSPFMKWSMENYDELFAEEERIKWDSLARTLRNQMAVPERRWSQLAQSSSETSS